MELTWNDHEQELLRSLDQLLARHAGPARARELGAGGYDHELHAALAAAGFLDLLDEPGGGPVDALLVVERVARAAGLVAAGAASLVRPALGSVAVGDVLAVATGPEPVARFAGPAHHLLLVDPDGTARLLPRGGFDHEPAARAFGPVLSAVHGAAAGAAAGAGGARPIDGRRVMAWWTLALVAEIVGTAQAAFDMTLEHVRDRHQFGRPIGSNQALQHRLALLAVRLEGTRLVAYETAWHGAEEARVAVTAAHAARLAKVVFREAQQMHGALGFTREYDLHLFTMRLRALLAELGPAEEHDVAAARARWLAPRPRAGADAQADAPR